MNEFIHPEDISPYEKLRQPSLLKQLLRCQKVRKLKNQPQYKILKSGQNKIAAKCKQENCPAFIKLIKVDDYFMINKKNTKHVHQSNKPMSDVKISGYKISTSASSKVVKQQLKKVLVRQQEEQKQKQCEMALKNTPAQLILGIYQSDLDAMAIYLQEKGFTFRSKNNQIKSQVPAILLYATKQMIKQFDHYGSFCAIYVDRIINMFTLTIANSQKMDFKFVIFSGINAGFHIIDFAYAIIDWENADNITYLFDQFFLLMGSKPETFIVKESQEKLVQALQQIEAKHQDISFIYDSEQTAKYIKSRQAKYKISEQDINICQQIVKSKDLKQYQYYIKLASNSFKEPNKKKQSKLLSRLLSKSKRICFSQFNEQKISGYENIEFSINSSIRSLIQRMFKNNKDHKKKTYSQIINISVNLIHQELARKKMNLSTESIHYQQIFQMPQLKYLRILLQRSIFRRLILMISECFSIFGYLETTNRGYVQVNARQTLIKLQIEKKGQRWECQCKFSNKEGLPCIHEVKICLLSKSMLTYQIHKRWMNLQIYQRSSNIEKSLNYFDQQRTQRDQISVQY